MSARESEHHFGIEDSQVEAERLENQAAAVLALALTLTGVSYAILIQVMF